MQGVAVAAHLSSAESLVARSLRLTSEATEATLGAIGRVTGSLDVRLYASDARTLGVDGQFQLSRLPGAIPLATLDEMVMKRVMGDSDYKAPEQTQAPLVHCVNRCVRVVCVCVRLCVCARVCVLRSFGRRVPPKLFVALRRHDSNLSHYRCITG